MDILTHVLTGQIIAHDRKREISWKFIFLISIISILPDFDGIFAFISREYYFSLHRKVFHSLLSILIIGVFLPKIIFKFFEIYLNKTTIIFILLSHLILDALTSWGTYLFFPFSSKMISLDVLFIIDPLFTSLLTVLLFLQIKKVVSKKLVIIFLCAYITGNFLIKKQYERMYNRKDYSLTMIPKPFTPLKWTKIYKSNLNSQTIFGDSGKSFDELSVSNYNNLSKIKNIFKDSSLFNKIDKFIRFPVIKKDDNDIYYYYDARFIDSGIENANHYLMLEMDLDERQINFKN